MWCLDVMVDVVQVVYGIAESIYRSRCRGIRLPLLVAYVRCHTIDCVYSESKNVSNPRAIGLRTCTPSGGCILHLSSTVLTYNDDRLSCSCEHRLLLVYSCIIDLSIQYQQHRPYCCQQCNSRLEWYHADTVTGSVSMGNYRTDTN